MFLHATHDSVEDRSDYYCFEAEDAVAVVGAERIIVQLEDVPPGTDYDLYLYENAQARADGRPIARSVAVGDSDEAIEWVDRFNMDDGGTWYVEVRRAQGHSCSSAYRLTINGLR